MPRLRLIIIAAALYALPARADKFLGIEAEGDAPTADAPAPAPAAKASPMKKEARAPVPPPGEGDFTFAGGLSAGSNFVRGRALVGYSFSRYVGLDTSAFYTRHDLGDTRGEEWGPEVDLVLRAPNPTICTPFVGAGPGYMKWQRRHQDELFSDGQTTTASAFMGVDLRLAPHFGIQAERRQTRNFDETPIRFDDRVTHEARMAIVNQIGFHVAF
jgi:hypothetical protein